MTSRKRSSKRAYRAPLQDHPVAIIGMSSIFPNAEDLAHYWDVILGEVDCITQVPPSAGMWMPITILTPISLTNPIPGSAGSSPMLNLTRWNSACRRTSWK